MSIDTLITVMVIVGWVDLVGGAILSGVTHLVTGSRSA
jgi:hypothetical protein